jgi:hypothetical protein
LVSGAGESLQEEKKRIKSIVLNEGQQTAITCPTGKVLRIKTGIGRVVLLLQYLKTIISGSLID